MTLQVVAAAVDRKVKVNEVLNEDRISNEDITDFSEGPFSKIALEATDLDKLGNIGEKFVKKDDERGRGDGRISK